MHYLKLSSGQKISELESGVREVKAEITTLKEKMDQIYKTMLTMKNVIESGQAGKPPSQQQKDQLKQFLN